MLSIRALVVKALDDTADILSNARFAQALAEGQDIDLEDIGVDSLSRFEAIMQIEEAKAVCRRCAVVDECLRWALETGQDAGVWGGLSEDERRALKRRNARLRARSNV